MDGQDVRNELLFDRSALHAGAANALDRNGVELLEAKQVGNVLSSEAPFPSRRLVGETITDGDLVGEPMMAWSDLSGQTIGRYFAQGGRLVALREEGYTKLRRLVEQAKRAKPFSSGLSSTFLEEETFRWWRATLRGQTHAPLSAHLLDAAEVAVTRHTLIVPLARVRTHCCERRDLIQAP